RSRRSRSPPCARAVRSASIRSRRGRRAWTGPSSPRLDTTTLAPMSQATRLIPLGGLGEVGKNMMVVESDDGIVVIDAGLSFPRDEHLGVDLVLPDFGYLREREGDIRAVVITHGHEDHTGSLPFLLRAVRVPEI